jgi:hypothetical protein
MTDVFLSYASTDRIKAATLATLLESAGWSVWWDRDIAGGEEWEPRLQIELDTARCVVALWSRRSIRSDWVVREACAARQRGVLLPVLLEPVQPPEELVEVQATALTAWVGEERSFELRPFLDRLADFLGGRPPGVDEPPLEAAAIKLSRIEIAQTVFDFCAVRVDFFRRRQSPEGVPDEVLDQMRQTYLSLCDILAPVSSDDVHNLISVNEGAFTPPGLLDP